MPYSRQLAEQQWSQEEFVWMQRQVQQRQLSLGVNPDNSTAIPEASCSDPELLELGEGRPDVVQLQGHNLHRRLSSRDPAKMAVQAGSRVETGTQHGRCIEHT